MVQTQRRDLASMRQMPWNLSQTQCRAMRRHFQKGYDVCSGRWPAARALVASDLFFDLELLTLESLDCSCIGGWPCHFVTQAGLKTCMFGLEST